MSRSNAGSRQCPKKDASSHGRCAMYGQGWLRSRGVVEDRKALRNRDRRQEGLSPIYAMAKDVLETCSCHGEPDVHRGLGEPIVADKAPWRPHSVHKHAHRPPSRRQYFTSRRRPLNRVQHSRERRVSKIMFWASQRHPARDLTGPTYLESTQISKPHKRITKLLPQWTCPAWV